MSESEGRVHIYERKVRKTVREMDGHLCKRRLVREKSGHMLAGFISEPAIGYALLSCCDRRLPLLCKCGAMLLLMPGAV